MPCDDLYILTAPPLVTFARKICLHVSCLSPSVVVGSNPNCVLGTTKDYIPEGQGIVTFLCTLSTIL